MPNKNYKVQFEVDDTIYNQWKIFLMQNNLVVHGHITHFNSIAFVEGIKCMMKNKKQFKKLVEGNNE